MTEPTITPIAFICMDCLLKASGGIWDQEGLHCSRCWQAKHRTKGHWDGICSDADHAHLGQEVA